MEKSILNEIQQLDIDSLAIFGAIHNLPAKNIINTNYSNYIQEKKLNSTQLLISKNILQKDIYPRIDDLSSYLEGIINCLNSNSYTDKIKNIDKNRNGSESITEIINSWIDKNSN